MSQGADNGGGSEEFARAWMAENHRRCGMGRERAPMHSTGRSIVRREEGIAGTTRDRGLGRAEGSRDGALGAARIILVDGQREVLAALRKLIEQDSGFVV